jgi:anaerobic glycerol-3-phosphate dehydrogenase
MNGTSDVACVPLKRRWEQILIHTGELNVPNLERMREFICEQRAAGTILSLKQRLIDLNLCSPECIEAATAQAVDTEDI